MNKMIKIIEILDNYAEEKEIVIPKYIKYFDRIYKSDSIMLVSKENIMDKLYHSNFELNDEVEILVEILEDNTEDIEEIEKLEYYYIGQEKSANLTNIIDKIEEIRVAVNKIRKDLNK